MHEYTITCSIIKILEEVIKKNNLVKINKVNFELSPIASIEPDSVRFYYEFLTKDNNHLKEAELKFSTGPMKLFCTECNAVFESSKMEFRCPECGSGKIQAADMDDIRIISVESDK